MVRPFGRYPGLNRQKMCGEGGGPESAPFRALRVTYPRGAWELAAAPLRGGLPRDAVGGASRRREHRQRRPEGESGKRRRDNTADLDHV